METGDYNTFISLYSFPNITLNFTIIPKAGETSRQPSHKKLLGAVRPSNRRAVEKYTQFMLLHAPPMIFRPPFCCQLPLCCHIWSAVDFTFLTLQSFSRNSRIYPIRMTCLLLGKIAENILIYLSLINFPLTSSASQPQISPASSSLLPHRTHLVFCPLYSLFLCHLLAFWSSRRVTTATECCWGYFLDLGKWICFFSPTLLLWNGLQNRLGKRMSTLKQLDSEKVKLCYHY